MPKTHLLAGLDIGNHLIKILLVLKKSFPSELEFISLVEEPSAGVRRGVVIDVEGVSEIIKSLLSKLKEETRKTIDSVCVNVDGCHLFSTPSHGIVSVSRADQKISQEDIQRVFQAAQTFSLPSNREIFDVFPREFIIDGERGIKEPLGLQGVRLETEILALGGFSPYLKNLSQAVLESDLEILDLVPSPMAAARSVLTPRQKELGVAVLDIGAGTSGLSVFEEKDLIHLAIIPIGSGNITNDIAIGLKCDINIAERIKIEFGTGRPEITKKREKIEIGEGETLIFSQKQLVQIIEDRVSEIFQETNKELKKIGKEKLLPAGIVLTGGGAKLSKILEIAKKKMGLPVRLGKPKGIEGLEEDPSLATICGLVLVGADLEVEKRAVSLGREIGSKIKKIFKIFIP